ncbi:MAG: SsrA-binding protein SmpB [Bacteroidota bacterium]|nr:SsrA-binding protein SmpB [Bacteroidota bacterium]
MASETSEEKVLIHNRKARHDFYIIETYEVGIVLKGTEVKSLRLGNANLLDSFAKIKGGEVWLENMHISPFDQASRNNHDPKRDRKLLLNKREIRRLNSKLQEEGTTLVPIQVYLKNNRIKVELAFARGKKMFDKREAIAKREVEREVKRKYGI